MTGASPVSARHLTSKKGDVTYTTFSVGVSAGKDHTTFFPVIVFGEYGETVAKHVTKGHQVLVMAGSR